jgi:hypothetical protein
MILEGGEREVKTNLKTFLEIGFYKTIKKINLHLEKVTKKSGFFRYFSPKWPKMVH